MFNNPPQVWHVAKANTAVWNYKSKTADKYSKAFYKGEYDLHKKFIEIENKGGNPSYTKYAEYFEAKVMAALHAKKLLQASYLQGCYAAAIHSWTHMRVLAYTPKR